MKRLLVLLSLAGVLVVSACSAASTSISDVDAAAFLTTAAQPGVTVIDVRTPEEYAQGHIDGAVNMSVESPDFAARIGALDKAGTYAVYCRSGRRSTLAVDQMAKDGFATLYNLKGGIADLQAAGARIVA